MSRSRNTKFELGKITEKQAENAITATADERKAFGLQRMIDTPADHAEPVYVALKYYDFEHECFSSWTRDELKEFSNFVGKLRELSWANLSGGLRPKPCKVEHAQHGARERLKRVRENLSREIQFIELRVSQRARVHGFRMKSAFFLVLLDRDHRAFPV
jgi:hypothetical protein